MQGLHTTTFHCPLPREAQRARAQEPCYLHLTGVGTQISMLPWLRIPRSKWQCHLDQNARHIAVRRRLVSWTQVTQVTQVIQIRHSNHSPTWVVHSSAKFCAVLHSLGTEWHWGVDVLLVWPSLWSPGCSRPRVAQWCTVTVHRVHRESRGGHIGRCRLNGWGRVIATRRCRRRLWRARYFGCTTWVYISNIEYTLSTTVWATGVTDGKYRRWNWSRASCEFWPKSISTWVWVCTLASEAWNSIDETHVPSDGHGACKEDGQWGVRTLGHFDTWCWFSMDFLYFLWRADKRTCPPLKGCNTWRLGNSFGRATGSCRYGHSKFRN